MSNTVKPDHKMNKKEEWEYFSKVGLEYITEAEDNWHNVHSQIEEDVKFILGIQWTAKDLEYFADQGIPPMVINHMRAIIQLGAGYQRQFKMKVRANKRRGQPDIAVTVFNRLFDTYDAENHWNDILASIYKYGFCGGLSVGGYRLDYTRNPITPQIVTEDYGPYAVMRDPYSTSLDLTDDRYIVHKMYLLPEELISAYKDFKSPSGETAEKIIKKATVIKDEGNRVETHVLYVKDFKDWVYYLALEDGSENETFKRGDIVFSHEKGKGKGIDKKFNSDKYQKVEGPVKTMKKIVYVGKKEMVAFGETDFPELLRHNVNGGFPYFFFLAEWWKHDTKYINAIQGAARQLRDVQKDKNARRIQQNRLLGQVAGEGWIQEQGAVVEGDNYLKANGNKLGKTITVNPNKPAPVKIRADLSGAGGTLLENKDDQEFNYISGINTEALASGDPRNLSGEAIKLRQRQAVISIQDYLDNFKFTRQIASHMWMVIADEKMSDTDIAGMISLTQEEQEQANALMATEGFNLERYNTIVADAINEEQQKAYDFQMMSQWVAEGVPIPFDVRARVSGVSDAEEIIQRVSEIQAEQAKVANQIKDQLYAAYVKAQESNKSGLTNQPAGKTPARPS